MILRCYSRSVLEIIFGMFQQFVPTGVIHFLNHEEFSTLSSFQIVNIFKLNFQHTRTTVHYFLILLVCQLPPIKCKIVSHTCVTLTPVSLKGTTFIMNLIVIRTRKVHFKCRSSSTAPSISFLQKENLHRKHSSFILFYNLTWNILVYTKF